MSHIHGTPTSHREAIALTLVRRVSARVEFPFADVVSLDGFSRVFPDISNEGYRGKLTFTEGGLEAGQFDGSCVSFSSSDELGRLGRSQVPYLPTCPSKTILPLKVVTNFGARLSSRHFPSVSLMGDFDVAYLVWPYGQLFDRHANPVISITRPGGVHA